MILFSSTLTRSQFDANNIIIYDICCFLYALVRQCCRQQMYKLLFCKFINLVIITNKLSTNHAQHWCYYPENQCTTFKIMMHFRRVPEIWRLHTKNSLNLGQNSDCGNLRYVLRISCAGFPVYLQ